MESHGCVAVIIALYNAEQTLQRCLKSVCAQTYEDLQILVIDDESTDDSRRIALRCAMNDSRITVMRYPHEGVAAARNHGLTHARAEFITFVDAHDAIAPDYIEHLVTHIEGVDLAVSGRLLKHGDKDFKSSKGTVSNPPEYRGSVEGIGTAGAPDAPGAPDTSDAQDTTDPIESADAVASYAVHLGGAGWKLYRSRVIEAHGIRFSSDIAFGEDTLFTLTYLHYCEHICCYQDAGYYYNVIESDRLSSGLSRMQIINSLGTSCARLRELWGAPLAHPVLVFYETCLAQICVDVIRDNAERDLSLATHTQHFMAIANAAHLDEFASSTRAAQPLLDEFIKAYQYGQYWPVMRLKERNWKLIDSTQETKRVAFLVKTIGSIEEFTERMCAIQAQTYSNLQILVFDDGTFRGPQAILEELALWDSRITWVWSQDASNHLETLMQNLDADVILRTSSSVPAPDMAAHALAVADSADVAIGMPSYETRSNHTDATPAYEPHELLRCEGARAVLQGELVASDSTLHGCRGWLLLATDALRRGGVDMLRPTTCIDDIGPYALLGASECVVYLDSPVYYA